MLTSRKISNGRKTGFETTYLVYNIESVEIYYLHLQAFLGPRRYMLHFHNRTTEMSVYALSVYALWHS